MTTFRPGYFEELQRECQEWQDKGFVELTGYVRRKGFSLTDLEIAGVLKIEELIVSMPTAMPLGEWKEELEVGSHGAVFASPETAEKIVDHLSSMQHEAKK